MDRIHRLGQRRPVEAIKLVVEDSIESRIVQLQEKKSAMIDATLSTDDSAMGRLTPEDVRCLLGFHWALCTDARFFYSLGSCSDSRIQCCIFMFYVLDFCLLVVRRKKASKSWYLD